MKKMDKKAFTLIELLVVIAVVGILVLLAAPRFTGYTQKAEDARIQHDIKVMEQEVGTMLINGDDDFNEWENNINDLNQLAQDDELFEKEGRVAKAGDPIDGTYKVIPKEYKGKINTKLKGTFYANSHGKVYYEHGQGPGYSDEELDDLFKNHDFIPIATAEELNNVRSDETNLFGKGTEWEDEYEGGLNKKYIQVADIDLSGYSEEEGWNPIGSYTNNFDKSPFTGSFDGNGYKITGLTINRPGTDSVGLFGYTEGATDRATISNVSLEDVNVTGKSYVGGLVGYTYSGATISNSYATGKVKGTDTYRGSAGGLVGSAYMNTTISNSYATVDVTGSGNNVGGLVGYSLYTNIENSYATGSVESSGRYTGGLVGHAYSHTKISNSYATGNVEGGYAVGGLAGGTVYGVTINNSYATGSVTGTGGRTGGLVGDANFTPIENSYATGSVKGDWIVGGLAGYADSSTIKNSYATGSATGNKQVGGLVGQIFNSGTISNSYATGSVAGTYQVGGLVGEAASYGINISNSYATGSVAGTYQVGGLVGEAASHGINISNSYATGEVVGSEDVGGLVGKDEEATISNSYWDTVTTKQPTSAGGGIGKSTVEMKLEGTYEGWDFESVWEITPENYPTLR